MGFLAFDTNPRTSKKYQNGDSFQAGDRLFYITQHKEKTDYIVNKKGTIKTILARNNQGVDYNCEIMTIEYD